MCVVDLIHTLLLASFLYTGSGSSLVSGDSGSGSGMVEGSTSMLNETQNITGTYTVLNVYCTCRSYLLLSRMTKCFNYCMVSCM